MCTAQTETSATVGAWVLLEQNEGEQAEGTVEGGGHSSQMGDTQAGVRRPAVSSIGGEP